MSTQTKRDPAVVEFIKQWHLPYDPHDATWASQLTQLCSKRQTHQPFEGVGLDFLTPHEDLIETVPSTLLIQQDNKPTPIKNTFPSSDSPMHSLMESPLVSTPTYPGLCCAYQDAKGRLKTPRYSLGPQTHHRLAPELHSSPFALSMSPIGSTLEASPADASLILLDPPTLTLKPSDFDDVPLFPDSVQTMSQRVAPHKKIKSRALVSKFLDIEAECDDESSDQEPMNPLEKDSFVVDDDIIEFDTHADVSLEQVESDSSPLKTVEYSLDGVSLGNIVHEKRARNPSTRTARATLRQLKSNKKPSENVSHSKTPVKDNRMAYREPHLHAQNTDSEDDSILIPHTTRKQTRKYVIHDSDEESDQDLEVLQDSPRQESLSDVHALADTLAGVELTHSSPKTCLSPTQKSITIEQELEDEGVDTSSLAPSESILKDFKNKRMQLARDYFIEFNLTVFDSQLPDTMEIKWSPYLRKTAGRTHTLKTETQDHVTYECTLELSLKIIDRLDRLRNTLIHEMCHAASWLIDKTNRPPHGKVFKKWANKAMDCYADIDITTSHTYEVDYPFYYQCTNSSCLFKFGRHSKSIDLKRKGCGLCASRLSLLM